MVPVGMDNIITKKILKTNNNIIQKLSEYIEFDVNLIINEDNDYAYVFGGAIRDILAEKEIHDVDILCLPTCAKKVERTILEQGYVYS